MLYCGVRGAVVLADGFDPAGQAGLARTSRAHGLRIVGPNRPGVLNTGPAVQLHAALAPAPPARGVLAVAMLQAAARCGAAISGLVSLEKSGCEQQ